VKFVIGPDGSVATAQVKSSTLGSPAVESCLVGQFRRMTFPQPHGTVVVTYPIAFAPQ
jgi:outer membrane biosynthesis protein TonB